MSSVHFDFVPPIPNLNGTSRDELEDQRRALLDALRNAQGVLAGAAPNGRDWQTARDPGAFKRAQIEHEKRADVLRLLVLAIERELEAVLDAEGGRP